MNTTNIRNDQYKLSRIKKAELASGVGALVVGIGIGSFFAHTIGPYSLWILTIGAGVHAWGMFDKHQVERSIGEKTVWWAEVLYWICWILIAILLVFLILKY